MTDTLADAADDLRTRSSDYGDYELGVFKLTPSSDDDSFILVGVDTTLDEAVSILESWEDDWPNLSFEGEETIGEFETVEVREYRLGEASN